MSLYVKSLTLLLLGVLASSCSLLKGQYTETETSPQICGNQEFSEDGIDIPIISAPLPLINSRTGREYSEGLYRSAGPGSEILFEPGYIIEPPLFLEGELIDEVRIEVIIVPTGDNPIEEEDFDDGLLIKEMIFLPDGSIQPARFILKNDHELEGEESFAMNFSLISGTAYISCGVPYPFFVTDDDVLRERYRNRES